MRNEASPTEATTDQVDPVSKEPALKCCAVAISPAGAPHELKATHLSERLASV